MSGKREADFGGFLGETLDIFTDGIRYVAAYVLVLGGLNATGITLGWMEPTDEILSFGGGATVDENSSVIGVIFELAVVIIAVLGSYFLLTKLLQTRDRLGEGGTRIWAYVGLTIVWALGFVAGLLALVVPGVIVLVRWSASTGYLIGGRCGIIESLGKSWDATRGYSWPIFFAALVWIIGTGIVGAMLGGLAGVTGSATALAVVTAFVEPFGNAVSFCLAVSVYYLVQNDEREIGEIFE